MCPPNAGLMLDQRPRTNVYDVGPTVNQHWVNACYLLRCMSLCLSSRMLVVWQYLKNGLQSFFFLLWYLLWLELLLGTGFESRSSRKFVIDAVHIQCSKLFKGLECAVLSMVLCTMKNHWSHFIRVGHNPDFGFPSVAILPRFVIDAQKAKNYILQMTIFHRYTFF